MSENPPLVLVDGFGGAGKSVLTALLDGAPELFVVPVQDAIISGFLRCNEIGKIIEHKDRWGLRKLLVNLSNLYMIEHYAGIGKLKRTPSVDAIFVTDFEFDFAGYEAECWRQITCLPQWTVPDLIYILYKNMPRYWINYNNKNDRYKYFVILDLFFKEIPSFFLETFPDGRVIALERPVLDLLATKYRRKPFKENFRSHYRSKLTIWDAVRSRDGRYINDRQTQLRALAARFPNRVLVVEFNELIERTEAVVSNVLNFLELPIREVNFSGSINHVAFPTEVNEQFLSKVNDAASALLGEKELCLLRTDIGVEPWWKLLVFAPNYFIKWAVIRAKLDRFDLPSKLARRVRKVLK